MQNIAVNGCLRQNLLPVEKKTLIYLFFLVYLRGEQCWLKDRIIFTNWGLSVISLILSTEQDHSTGVKVILHPSV